jgi:uncharacterized protein
MDNFTIMKLTLKVVPGASSNGIAGWLGDSLKVRVAAPAESGKANAAVKEVLATALNIPKQAVKIVSGNTAPRKVVEICNLSEKEAYERLSVNNL